MLDLISALPEIFIVLCIALILGLLGLFIVRITLHERPARKELVEAGFVLVGIGFVGGAVGELSGLSRTGVVGTVVPAILTAIAGFNVYIFGQQKAESPVVNAAVFVFVASCLLSYNQAAAVRNGRDQADFCMTQYAETTRSSAKDALQNFETIFGNYCSGVFQRFSHPTSR
jgi:drug/metabolite transporter (DMT)-like permease